MGSKYNLLIKWENRERTAELIAKVLEDAPYEVALYVMQNNLLDDPVERDAREFLECRIDLQHTIISSFLRDKLQKPKQRHSREHPSTNTDMKSHITMKILSGWIRKMRIQNGLTQG